MYVIEVRDWPTSYPREDIDAIVSDTGGVKGVFQNEGKDGDTQFAIYCADTLGVVEQPEVLRAMITQKLWASYDEKGYPHEEASHRDDRFVVSVEMSDEPRSVSRALNDIGISIGPDGGIDGLVHLSDISWNEVGEEEVRRFKR